MKNISILLRKDVPLVPSVRRQHLITGHPSHHPPKKAPSDLRMVRVSGLTRRVIPDAISIVLNSINPARVRRTHVHFRATSSMSPASSSPTPSLRATPAWRHTGNYPAPAPFQSHTSCHPAACCIISAEYISSPERITWSTTLFICQHRSTCVRVFVCLFVCTFWEGEGRVNFKQNPSRVGRDSKAEGFVANKENQVCS